MSEMSRRRAETEGRRGSRTATDEGGRYVGIPLNGQCSVQETGCGTATASTYVTCARSALVTPFNLRHIASDSGEPLPHEQET